MASLIAFDNLSFVFPITHVTFQGCVFVPEGALHASLKIFLIISKGTFWGETLLSDARLLPV